MSTLTTPLNGLGTPASKVHEAPASPTLLAGRTRLSSFYRGPRPSATPGRSRRCVTAGVAVAAAEREGAVGAAFVTAAIAVRLGTLMRASRFWGDGPGGCRG